MNNKVLIIGGGASGMFSAIKCAEYGLNVTLIEKNEKLGKKIYITGKGRCNLLNLSSPKQYLENVCSGQKFMYGPIFSFTPEETYSYFEQIGLPLEVTRGNRVFPKSEKASDVTRVMTKQMEKSGVKIMLNEEVKSLIVDNGQVSGVHSSSGDIYGDYVIVATGGLSYPLTGSTGDGYRFAKETGHRVVDCVPSLCGLYLKGYNSSLAGLTLKNVGIKVEVNKKIVYEESGEALFTHKGISGPIILTASAKINRLDLTAAKVIIDLKPYIDNNETDKRLIKIFNDNKNKDLINVLPEFLPKPLIYEVLNQSNINEKIKVNSVTKEMRQSLSFAIKSLTYDIQCLEGFSASVITAGGVELSQINPKTMESKIIKNLYFIGEVIDVDCLTGGYNLQEAFSTAYVSAKAIKERYYDQRF